MSFLKKLKIDKKKLYLAAYVLITGGLALAGIICFGNAQYQKAKYASSSVALTGAQSQLSMLEVSPPGDEVDDKKAWYGEIAEHFTTVNQNDANAYKSLSVPAYIFTTLSLVAFGLCLKHADVVKAREEKE